MCVCVCVCARTHTHIHTVRSGWPLPPLQPHSHPATCRAVLSMSPWTGRMTSLCLDFPICKEGPICFPEVGSAHPWKSSNSTNPAEEMPIYPILFSPLRSPATSQHPPNNASHSGAGVCRASSRIGGFCGARVSAASSAPHRGDPARLPLRVSGVEPVPWKWACSPGLPINLASESHKVGGVPSQGARSTRSFLAKFCGMVRKILAPPFESCEKGSQASDSSERSQASPHVAG